MLEIYGDAWKEYTSDPSCILAITTNGFVKNNGECVMGRGIAFTAKNKFPDLPYRLGQLIIQHGNVPFYMPKLRLVTFPVKHNWWENADIQLIKRSATKLVQGATRRNITKIILPRPGCGNGKLSWKSTVRPALAPILDDRFYVITWKKD